jgi:hypothetical protein
VNADGVIAPVTQLFRSITLAAGGGDVTSPAFRHGDLLYGFAGRTHGVHLLVRWNAESIAFYRGRVVPAKTAGAAFQARPGH